MQLKQFQNQVSDLLLRHRSLMDVLSKFDQSNSSIHRAVVKAVTECGCIEIQAQKQTYSSDMTLEQAKDLLENHLQGKLCDQCKEAVVSELGKNLFYMSSLCNLLDIELEDAVNKESKKCATLGFFNLS
ncbi:DUF1573 domain-containing protein [Chengkuizengella axinellae]|uniref:DUF1573 domain-containing protein n=1 Tax=Chengkuizengella axinellae TaxID=3064388 RepID=A0ABT9J7B5_9BACL|nr:DUF1573 domain-containing protein [Chengkuizengella sp. 2205SS18-9]MDP5276854.1 DUF1573 domain-containing protein [Chengkuizengella sp. 2205SS18-9]